MSRHMLSPAVRAATLTALAAVMVTAGLAPASAAPGHPASTGGGRPAQASYPWRVRALPARPVRASVPKRTLTVKATNLAGQPDTGGTIQVFNIDGMRVPVPGKHFTRGVARLRVPAGHYFALASFGGLSDPRVPLRLVVVPQVNVTGNTTVTVPETAASSEITMVTPRPAAVLDTDVWLRRTTASGPAVVLEGYFPTSQQIWVSPTRAKPTVGTLQMDVNRHLESPPGHGVPYEYTLSYTDRPGTIPAQRYVAHTKDLATIHEVFSQPVKSAGGFAFNGSFPAPSPNTSWFGFVEPAGPGLTLPGRFTEYAGGTGSARMEWSGQYAPFRGVPFVVETQRVLRPGEHLTDNWGASPLHPGMNVLLTTEQYMFGATVPSALRAGNTLRLALDPFDDNEPGHQTGVAQTSGPAKTAGSYEIDQNGTKIASGNAVSPGTPNGELTAHATLSPKPSTIRFSLDLARAQTDTDFPLSTTTSTVWTWHTAPAAGATLPPGWTCKQFIHNRDCAIQPMMTLGYAVAGLGLDGATKPGQQRLHLTAGHLQGATTSRITEASVSVSFDGGTTWHRAKISGSGGSYTAAFTAPAGAKVTLRTRAADAAGGSVAETITSAYQTGS